MDAVKKKHWWQSPQLTWSVIGLLCLLVGYLVVLMYAQGEYLFAIMTLILSSVGLYIFANRKAYAWRYVYPGLAGMGWDGFAALRETSDLPIHAIGGLARADIATARTHGAQGIAAIRGLWPVAAKGARRR